MQRLFHKYNHCEHGVYSAHMKKKIILVGLLVLIISFVFYTINANISSRELKNSPSKNSANSLTTEHKLILKVVQIGTYNFPWDNNYCYCSIDIKLINNTDSVCKFYAYSCITSFSVIMDPNEGNLCGQQCSLNYPTLFVVKPKQTLSIPVILQANPNMMDYSVRFGLVMVIPGSFSIDKFREVLVNMKKNKENVLWSDPVMLQSTGGCSFEIGNN